MPRLAKYPSTLKMSKSHTTQMMFVNRTRPRQSDGIAGASFVPGRPSPLVHSVAVSVKLLAVGTCVEAVLAVGGRVQSWRNPAAIHRATKNTSQGRMKPMVAATKKK